MTSEEESASMPPPAVEQPPEALQRLLKDCRAATGVERDERFRALAAYLLEQKTDNETIQTRMAQETVAGSILTDWAYQTSMEPVLDACGVAVAISTCATVLKEIAATKASIKIGDDANEKEASALSSLPPRTIVDNCWKAIQRMLLNSRQEAQKQQGGESESPKRDTDDNDGNQDDNDATISEAILIADTVECQEFVTKVVLLLPQMLANACHVAKLQVPLHATVNYFYPRLVYTSCRHRHSQDNNTTLLYAQVLIQNLLQTRQSEFVARGLVQWLESLSSKSSETDDASTILAPFLQSLQLTAKDTANLIFVLLQQMDSATNDNKNQSTAASQVLQACRSLFQSSSMEDQRVILERLVFSRHVIAPGMELRWSQWVIHVMTPPIDGEGNGDSISSFLDHITTIAERWSQSTFLQQVDGRQQHHVSLVLWRGLQTVNRHSSSAASSSAASPSLSLQDNHELTLAIMQGVSQRLESTLTTPRQDGMRIAKELAKGLGQDIEFDELQDDDEDVEKGVEGVNEKSDDKATDQEAKVDSSEAIDDDDGPEEWDDELVPYDLDDDEEDLAETPKPLRLLEALDLLRTGENHDHAYTRLEAALNALPELIRSRPDDLPDVAVSLALQLLRMEDKFSLDNFSLRRQSGLMSLLVEEPMSVGSALIEQLFEDGGLGDRLNVLSALQVAAMELSGNHQPPSGQEKNGKNIPSGFLTNRDSETKALSLKQGTEVLSKTRMKRSRPSQKVIKNRFAPVAPMWFYSMISGFLKHRDDEAIWSGSTGSIFLAHFFRCLATIVEFSGFQASQVLAGDLLDLVWDFRTADVPEVRLSVLVSVATSMAMLPEERIFAVLMQEDTSLPKAISDISGSDPDKQCRALSKTIAQSIYDVIQNSKT